MSALALLFPLICLLLLLLERPRSRAARTRQWSITRLLGAVLLVAGLTTAQRAAAQSQIKPRILVLFDTSGSMAWRFDGSESRGDGSTDPWTGGRTCCPGNGGSRLYSAKRAMYQMIMASGDIEFALMKFHQTYTTNQSAAVAADWYYGNQSASAYDLLRYWYTTNTFSGVDRRPWLCVGWGAQTGIQPDDRDVGAENEPAEVAMWLDHHEYSASTLGQVATSIFRGPYNDYREQELRADGNTPLGEALQAAYNYINEVHLEEELIDPDVAACRPYSVVLLTDGEWNGTIDPIPQVDQLHDTLGVDTWVIGLAFSSTTLDHMAEVGGCHFDPAQPRDQVPYNGAGPDCANPAGHAFLASSESSLSAILFQIVSGSILTEVCNGYDDDCDGETDEGFELYCDAPDAPAEVLCTDPGEALCDGVDNNCDGETDEGLSPPDDGWGAGFCSNTGEPFPFDPYTGACTPGTYECQGSLGWVCAGGVGPTAESCNAIDDDCDGDVDDGVAWNPLWGPNECGDYGLGECSLGTYHCDETTAGAWVCTGASTPGVEGATCTGLDEDCDGATDEGISQACGGGPGPDPNAGICQQGIQYCDAGASTPLVPAWLPCAGAVGPRPSELCNTLDDDCDGATDEEVPGMGAACGGANPSGCPDYPLGACPDGADQGECAAGALQCVLGAVSCAGNVNPASEGGVCDDADNDCDGRTDEGISQVCGGCDGSSPLNPDCLLGPNQGQCMQGFQNCNPLGPGWGTCQGSVGPSTEACDNVDNDCDGATDETFPLDGAPCGGAPGPDPEAGACSQGALTCAGGVVQCTGGQGPVPEGAVCDGVDNDCDGATDEWITLPCGGGPGPDPDAGVCQEGFAYCPAVGDPTCYGSIGPLPAELCNNLDDDCDGATDEGIADVPDSCGACGDGTTSCVGGELTCVGGTAPDPESCNAADDDCDGFTDEGLTDACGGAPLDGCPGYPDDLCPDGADQGQCQPGITTCGMGAWGSCLGAIGPSAEICDGLDNDCDGATDEEEDLLGIGADDGVECSPGYGICDAAWLYCALDGTVWSVECCVALAADDSCIEPAGPETEVCDGLDNDCDSLTDEEFPTLGDDCDPAPWVTDPGYSYLNGECSPGAIACVFDATELWHEECLGGEGPNAESCNLLDDDCDGATDEGVVFVPPDCSLSATDDPAEGICEPGVWLCVSGTPECAGSGPEDEECNGLDDDCDGETDEELINLGEPCGNDLGICDPGTVQCVCDSAMECDMECVGATAGVDELCNLLDDDCDGLTDEPEDLSFGVTCSNSQTSDPNEGICNEGVEVCVDGEWECNANEPMPEICDGKDNDCDGLTDEDTELACPGEAVCVEGQCAEPCWGDELLCPDGKVCEEINGDYVCISDVCNEFSDDALPCVENPYWCDEGYTPPCHCEAVSAQCVDDCYDVVCPDGYVCVPEHSGTCHLIGESCYVDGCPDGLICVAFECVADPCHDVVCVGLQYCNAAGECVDSCVDIDCPDGMGCYEGACVDDPCAGVLCDPGYSCVDGDCVVGDCWGVNCEYYEVCVDGECVEDPCWNIECPNGLVCIDGACYEYDPPAGDSDGDGDADGDGDGDADADGDADGDSDTLIDGVRPGMKHVLATGMGGCLCSAPGTPGAAGPGGLWLLLGAALLGGLRFARRRPELVGALIGGAVLLAGCQIDPYDFADNSAGDTDTTTGGADGDVDGDADGDSDGDGDTDTSECVFDAGDHDCDGLDDDCDGTTDEDVDTAHNVFHCGECNNECAYANAFASCEDGTCEMGDCASYFYDVNAADTDGCEYFCQPTSTSDNCNGVALGPDDPFYTAKDDDCDGEVDEDVDFESNPLHCGWCGHVCYFAHAAPLCVAGVCQMGDCHEGFADLDTDSPGCEYECTPSADEEACNGLDDDCDGATDEDDPGGGGECYTVGAGCSGDPLVCDGVCAPGTWHCVLGVLKCQGQVGPAAHEACNDLDDDCDGATDEEADIPLLGPLADDPSPGPLCGSSTGVCERGRMRCAYADASDTTREARCCDTVDVDGVCVPPLMPGDLAELAPDGCDGYDNDCDGRIDEDPDDPLAKMTNGECWWPAIVPGAGTCEPGALTCFGSLGVASWICLGATGPAPEQCNDLDDDCDGETDEGVIRSCGGCDVDVYPYCTDPDAGRCQQGISACATSGPGWGPCVGDIGPIAELCNAKDDDCDGATDEGITALTDPQVGQPCPGKVGACAGLTVCNVVSGTIGCDNPLEPGAAPEVCDGADNDCDGFTDEGLVTSCGGADPAGCDPTVHPGGICPDGADQGPCVAGVSVCTDGSPSACLGSVEAACAWDDGCDACDGVDNDCDGVTDEDYAGGAVCGPCGNGTYVCLGGIEQCTGGTVPTAEVCDGIDNNCDGDTDEGLFRSCGGAPGPDPDLGACQHGIQYCDPALSAPLAPVYGPCQSNVDPSAEICDGEDNDCDGATDEAAELTPPAGVCDADCPGSSLPLCLGAAGWDCDYHCTGEGGPVECDSQGNPLPVESLCDGLDNNCDGAVDEPFDLDYDVHHCGACEADCATDPDLWPQPYVPDHVATFGCIGGTCAIIQCADGYWDDATSGDDDCDVGPCALDSGGVETCDGQDDDCDGLTDEGIAGVEVCNGYDDDCDGLTDGADPDLTLPPSACKRLGACAGVAAVAECNGATSTWSCHYELLPNVEQSGGALYGEETRCDGIDGDCDGWVDEHVVGKGTSCDNGGSGGCLVGGKQYCKSPTTELNGLICCQSWSPSGVCTTPVPAAATLAGPELCDAVDNDCDGTTDEGVGDSDPDLEWITISSSSPPWSYDMFAYEASRPDAQSYDAAHWGSAGYNSPGTKGTAACSFADRVSWTMVTHDEAEEACWKLNASGGYEVGGWDLCTAEQWEYACAFGGNPGATPHRYPYGNSYQAATCNGHDYSATWDHQIGCGTAAGCYAESSVWSATLDVYDLSGNLEEWTATDREVGSDTLYEIRGGSYNDLAGGMSCDFDFWAALPGFAMPNLGFRCCRGDDPESACSVALAGLANHPFDFQAGGSGCSADGWTLEPEWEVGTPTTGTAHEGGCAIATDLDNTYEVSQDDEATSPTMDIALCAGQQVTLNWWMWFDLESNATCAYDWADVQVSSNGGTSWTTVTPSPGYSSGSVWCGDLGDPPISPVWQHYTANVSAYVSASFRVRFRMHSDSSVNDHGVYVDYVYLESAY